MKRKYLLDAGHGGVLLGHYLTFGKRSPGKKTESDTGIFEGEFNREVCAAVYCELPDDTVLLNPGPINITMRDRISTVNRIAKLEDVFLISIHSNASPKPGWSDANGFKVFIAPNASKASRMMCINMETALRSKTAFEYRKSEEVNYSILSKTSCPAVLLELGFMTNMADAHYCKNFADQIGLAIVEGIKLFDKTSPF